MDARKPDLLQILRTARIRPRQQIGAKERPPLVDGDGMPTDRDVGIVTRERNLTDFQSIPRS
jgi:hypothetical protein